MDGAPFMGPKLETDASANDYGQAEPKLTNAIRIAGMPLANVHAYHLKLETRISKSIPSPTR